MARREKEDYSGKRYGSIALWREIELARTEHEGVVYHQISRGYESLDGEAICADEVVAAGNWVRLYELKWQLTPEVRRQAALQWGSNVPEFLYLDPTRPTRVTLTNKWLNLHTFERAECTDPAGPAALQKEGEV